MERLKKLSDDKVIQGERGSASETKRANQTVYETIKFTPTPIWSEVAQGILGRLQG